jgi:tetratricopeptide (TPR) repeat protein/tRNA A-37 threonylcarbamoyl transferase component Bud32
MTGGLLRSGENFGPRYHIIRSLGVGGMGAVYQAWDQVLETAVAIKVIRPETIVDPAAAEELERRFKRELLLARQVTHRNVVRIHDLGEIDGIKYITMPYIHGSNLAAILKRDGRLPVDRAIAVARDIASGLVAAHEAGVVHRDLKPANIMIDEDGTALIMDFGIARSTSGMTGFGRTATGVVLGTIEYMAPEHARGMEVDARSDLYSFGLIVNDMLLGHRQGPSSGVTELMSRIQEAPASVRSVDPTIPAAVDAFVTKCLQPDPAVRYQSMSEVLADLERLEKSGYSVLASTARVDRLVGGRRRWVWAAAVVVVVALAGATWPFRDRFLGATVQPQAAAVSVAVLPFRNASGDQSMDWLGPNLAEILRNELGQSASLRTVGSARLSQLLQDLRIAPETNMDPATLRKLAEFSNAQTVIWGQFVKLGTQIQILANLEDIRNERSIPISVQAANESAVVATIGELARAARASLTPAAAATDLATVSSKPSSQSLLALRYYNEGLALNRQGKPSEALRLFEASTKEDPEFALAYARLAEAHKNLRFDNEAEQSALKARDLSNALPPRERYLVLAAYARVVGNNDQALESYEKLLQAAPEDTDVRFELARLYEDTGSLDQAGQHYRRVLEDDPRYIDALLAMGRVEVGRGQPQAALDPLNQALSLAVQLDNREARGNILNALGIAYRRLNKPDEALRYYQDALQIRRALGQQGGTAASLSEIAQLNAAMGRPEDALKYHLEALAIRREIGDKRGIGNTLTALGNLYLRRGDTDEALTNYRQALQLQRDQAIRAPKRCC